jgi:hypothetical protein
LSFLSPVRPFIALAVSLATLAVAAGSPAPAIADGDPASDVLASQPIFLPQDSGATAKQQAQLGAILAAAQKSGYRIRAAVIATPADLGSVGALWRQPQSYAQFLGQELSLVFKGTLLVVMPGGFGVYDVGRQKEIRQSALARSAPPEGGGLVSATLDAIQRLAAASGHPLPVQATATLPGSTSDHAGTWVALAIGAVVIAAAWAASLRAMPPKRLTRTSARAS